MAVATRLRLLYFLYYGGVGVLLPFYAPFLRGLGFSGREIGLVQMLSPAVAPLAALGWAAYADRHASPGGALRRATLLAAAGALLLPWARTPLAAGAAILLTSLGSSAVVPLVDSVTLEHCRAHPAASYARIRLFGSLGFVVLTLAAGAALAARGDRPGDALVPAAVAVLALGYAAAARRVPAEPAHPDRPGPRDMLALLADRRLLVFLLACTVHWGAIAPFHLLFGVFVRDLGLGAGVTGLGMAVGVAAEIGVMLAMPRLEARFSPRVLFSVAFVGSAVRWALLSRATGAAAVVALQALHGLTFGLFWAGAMQAMAALVPSRLRATGQALFSAIVFGAGNTVGYALAGAGYDLHRSVAPLFGWAALVELVPLAAALALFGPRAWARSGTAP